MKNLQTLTLGGRLTRTQFFSGESNLPVGHVTRKPLFMRLSSNRAFHGGVFEYLKAKHLPKKKQYEEYCVCT
jgi:hypothetical protein